VLNFCRLGRARELYSLEMTEIQCPRCGGQAAGTKGVWSDKKPYCPACGWNVDRANLSGGKNQNLLTIYLVAIALGIVGIFAASVANPHRGNFVPFAFVLLVLALISWHRAKKSAQTAGPAVSPSFKPANASASSASSDYERLRIMRRPRAIRMKTPIRIFVIVYTILLVSVGYGLLLAVTRGGDKTDFHSQLPNLFSLAVFALIWGVIAIVMFRSIVRHRSLLIDGEIAMGTITSQTYAGGESRGSNIVYEFKDAAGRTYTGKGSDPHSTLFEEMQTPVFYDATNPGKNVALAAAAYSLIDP
jgi:hypothetical protein